MSPTCAVETQITNFFSNGTTMPLQSTLHGLSGKFCSVCSELMHITFSLIGNKVAVLDDSLFLELRHKQCEMMLPGDAAGHPVRCSVCATYRTSLLTMQTHRMANCPGSSSVNYRQAIL